MSKEAARKLLTKNQGESESATCQPGRYRNSTLRVNSLLHAQLKAMAAESHMTLEIFVEHILLEFLRSEGRL